MVSSSLQPSLSVQVKQHTEKAHKETETILLPVLMGLQSNEGYAHLLKMFYGFFLPIEALIQQQVSEADLSSIHQRRTSAYLMKDLIGLGIDVKTVAVCTQLPVIENRAQAFGAMYVLEGSTLGGRMIAKLIKRNGLLTVSPDHLHFFDGYGEATGTMWTSFLAALNEQPETILIMEAANETFIKLKNWMKGVLVYE